MVGRSSDVRRKAKLMKQIYGRLSEGSRKAFGVFGGYSEISEREFENVEWSSKMVKTI